MGPKAALRMMGRADVADERVRAYFAEFDADGNGTLDFEEFKGLARRLDAWSECSFSQSASSAAIVASSTSRWLAR